MGSHHPIRKTVTPEPVAIPDKLYFRIGDVARLCDVPPYVLRFWETEFPQLKPNKGGTGQRLYRRKDVEMVLRVKSLLYDQGYTIPGARQILKTGIAPVEHIASGEPSLDQHTKPGAPPLSVVERVASEMWAGKTASQPEPHDHGAELRLRAQLADLRDDLQSVLNQLSQPLHSRPIATSSERAQAAVQTPAIAPAPAPRPRPLLVLEPRPVPRAVPHTGLHLANQGDLFSAE